MSKPEYKGVHHGDRVWMWGDDGSQEVWEWRLVNPAEPLFDVSASMSNSELRHYKNVPAVDAARITELVLKYGPGEVKTSQSWPGEESVLQQICLTPAAKVGDWHLVETIPAQQLSGESS